LFGALGTFAQIGNPPVFLLRISVAVGVADLQFAVRTLFGGYCQWVLDAVRQTAEWPISH
jgi:hypothetical protein